VTLGENDRNQKMYRKNPRLKCPLSTGYRSQIKDPTGSPPERENQPFLRGPRLERGVRAQPRSRRNDPLRLDRPGCQNIGKCIAGTAGTQGRRPRKRPSSSGKEIQSTCRKTKKAWGHPPRGKKPGHKQEKKNKKSCNWAWAPTNKDSTKETK